MQASSDVVFFLNFCTNFVTPEKSPCLAISITEQIMNILKIVAITNIIPKKLL